MHLGLPTTKHALVLLKNAPRTCFFPLILTDSAQIQPSHTNTAGLKASPMGILEKNKTCFELRRPHVHRDSFRNSTEKYIQIHISSYNITYQSSVIFDFLKRYLNDDFKYNIIIGCVAVL